jgi:maleate cis-trans isomerase
MPKRYHEAPFPSMGFKDALTADLFLGKPVIAINTATYWHALRAQGINDKVAGFGHIAIPTPSSP